MTLRSLTKPWTLVFIFSVVIALTGGYALSTYFQRANVAEADTRQAERDTASIAGPASSLSADVKAACKDDGDTLSELGINCGSAVETQEAIADAPTKVVEGPTGPRGPIGPTGPGAAIEQIRTAIAAYCDARDECSGPAGSNGADGSDGLDGANGSDSTVAGPRGLAGSDSTVPGPRGPAGESIKGDAGAAGSPGRDGTDGRGIASLACTGSLTPLTLTLTYSDGTTAAVECGPTLEPDPEPAP